jgi:beta-lactamase class A
MQSVFKLPLALAVLQRVERGDFSLDQSIDFLTADCYPDTYSPLQDAHPQGGVVVPLRELLELAVLRSDNTAADILLRVIGGPATVQASLNAMGLKAIHVRDSERTLHDDDAAQYRNDAEPAAMVALLRLLSDQPPLSAEHTALLLRWMIESPTGPKRIKALLPPGVIVAHKTGTSGEKNGRIAATNDVGLITLPDGRRLALAVFVTDAAASQETCEAVIARVAKAIYEHATADAP